MYRPLCAILALVAAGAALVTFQSLPMITDPGLAGDIATAQLVMLISGLGLLAASFGFGFAAIIVRD